MEAKQTPMSGYVKRVLAGEDPEKILTEMTTSGAVGPYEVPLGTRPTGQKALGAFGKGRKKLGKRRRLGMGLSMGHLAARGTKP